MANTNDFRDPNTGKVDWDAYDKAQKQETIADLVRRGFREDLTDDQLYVITEPMEAPENYHCDGEISNAQAKRRWLNNLSNSGLTAKEIRLARQYNGI
jgi:hypothetical protein